MTVPLIVTLLMLLPGVALTLARSAWGRRTLACVCIGLGTALPLAISGGGRDSNNTDGAEPESSSARINANAHRASEERPASLLCDLSPTPQSAVTSTASKSRGDLKSLRKVGPWVSGASAKLIEEPVCHVAWLQAPVDEGVRVCGDFTPGQIECRVSAMRRVHAGRSP